MSDSTERKTDGTFKDGHKGIGGRPSKARELAYLAVAQEVCALNDWRAIVTRAKIDAIAGEDGATRERGRRFLADYLIGRPKQVVAVEHDGESVYEQYADLSDDELAELIAQAEQSDGGTGALDSELSQPGMAGRAANGATAAAH